MLWRMLCFYTLHEYLYLTALAQLSSSVASSTFQKRMSLGWQMSRNPRQMITAHTQGSFVSSLEQVQHKQSALKPLGKCCSIDLHVHCKSGQPVHAQPLHNTRTMCRVLAVDILHLYASCLGTFDQKNARPLANSKFIWSWNINCLARSPAQGIFLWMMWSGRHYMIPVIVLYHMLSFNCFSYLDVAFILFFGFHLYSWFLAIWLSIIYISWTILMTQEVIFGSFPVFLCSYIHCVLPCLQLISFFS